MSYKNLFALLVVAGSLLHFQPANAQQQANQSAGCYAVPNALFNDAVNGAISGWTGSSWGGSQANYTINQPGYNSRSAAGISMYAFVTGTSAKLRSDSFAVAPNSQLTFGFHARGNADTVQVQAVQLDSNRAVLDYTWLNSVPLHSNSSNWNQYKNSLVTLAQTRFVQLEFVLKSSGSVFIDNVWLSTNATGANCVNTTNTIDTGSTGTATQSTNTASPDSITNQQLAQGIVFSRTDKNEYRWVQSNGASGVGNRWITQACAEQLGSVVVRGNWSQLNAIAPAFDAIANPCDSATQTNSAANNDASKDPLRAEIVLTPNGYVFHRTDKNETRWVDVTASGSFGSQWISPLCAVRLGAVQQVYGNWSELMALAPALSGVRAPC